MDPLKEAIVDELLELRHQLNAMIAEINQIAKTMNPFPIEPCQLRNADGNPTLAPLIIAKSQVLIALINLREKT